MNTSINFSVNYLWTWRAVQNASRTLPNSSTIWSQNYYTYQDLHDKTYKWHLHFYALGCRNLKKMTTRTYKNHAVWEIIIKVESQTNLGRIFDGTFTNQILQCACRSTKSLSLQGPEYSCSTSRNSPQLSH